VFNATSKIFQLYRGGQLAEISTDLS